MLLTQEQLITRSLRNLENNLIAALRNYHEGKPGGTPFRLKHGQQLHRKIAEVFKQEYGVKIKEVVAGFSEVEKLIQKTFKDLDIPFSVTEKIGKVNVSSEYTKIDKGMFRALKQQTFDVYSALGMEAQNRIAQAVYDAVLPWVLTNARSSSG